MLWDERHGQWPRPRDRSEVRLGRGGRSSAAYRWSALEPLQLSACVIVQDALLLPIVPPEAHGATRGVDRGGGARPSSGSSSKPNPPISGVPRVRVEGRSPLLGRSTRSISEAILSGRPPLVCNDNEGSTITSRTHQESGRESANLSTNFGSTLIQLVPSPLGVASLGGAGSRQCHQVLAGSSPVPIGTGIRCQVLPNHGVYRRVLQNGPNSGTFQSVVIENDGQIHTTVSR